MSSLTSREKELLGLVVTGMQNKKIAELLTISENTVRNHIANIFSKLKVANRTEASMLYHQKQMGMTSAKIDSIDPAAKYYESPRPHQLEQRYGSL